MTTRRRAPRSADAPKTDAVFMPWVDKYDHTLVWPEGMPLPSGIENGERRFKIETTGFGWNVIRKVTGLAVRKAEGGAYIYGDRSLNAPKESGYNMEGRVSIGGKSYRAFTSSELFLVNGKLVDMAILYVVGAPKTEEAENPIGTWTNEQITIAVVGGAALAAAVGGLVYVLTKPKVAALPPATSDASHPPADGGSLPPATPATPATPAATPPAANPPVAVTPPVTVVPIVIPSGAPSNPSTSVLHHPPVNLSTAWKHMALDANGDLAFMPGVKYRFSIPVWAGETFQGQGQRLINAGFVMVGAYDVGASLPSDWPSDDHAMWNWRYEMMRPAGSAPYKTTSLQIGQNAGIYVSV